MMSVQGAKIPSYVSNVYTPGNIRSKELFGIWIFAGFFMTKLKMHLYKQGHVTETRLSDFFGVSITSK